VNAPFINYPAFSSYRRCDKCEVSWAGSLFCFSCGRIGKTGLPYQLNNGHTWTPGDPDAVHLTDQA
jgi:hypothetical protein